MTRFLFLALALAGCTAQHDMGIIQDLTLCCYDTANGAKVASCTSGSKTCLCDPSLCDKGASCTTDSQCAPVAVSCQQCSNGSSSCASARCIMNQCTTYVPACAPLPCKQDSDCATPSGSMASATCQMGQCVVASTSSAAQCGGSSDLGSPSMTSPSMTPDMGSPSMTPSSACGIDPAQYVARVCNDGTVLYPQASCDQGVCKVSYPDCPTPTSCMSDVDCKSETVQCSDGSTVTASAVCKQGICVKSTSACPTPTMTMPSSGSSVCKVDTDCPTPTNVTCMVCTTTNTKQCPSATCVSGQCTLTWPANTCM